MGESNHRKVGRASVAETLGDYCTSTDLPKGSRAILSPLVKPQKRYLLLTVHSLQNLLIQGLGSMQVNISSNMQNGGSIIDTPHTRPVEFQL
jgi:hypothetical protein